jgi:AcrR family transcriptional regulator
MRKLASRLGITAKTIYNYYQSKDELYLAVLTMGFEKLYNACLSAQHSQPDPLDQLRAMIRAYLDFGLDNPHLYNLMFSSVAPKFKDYVGTKMEPSARQELETSLKSSQLFIQTIKACAACSKNGVGLSEDEARLAMILFWTQAHGYVAGVNNTVLEYMHENPLAVKEVILQAILDNLERFKDANKPTF